MIILDFETRSHCDLPLSGTANYVAHPSTDIVCMAVYNTDTGYKEIWYPAKGPLSDQIRYAFEGDNFIAAHNAEFDQGVYEFIGVSQYDFPEIPAARWYCTMAQCRVNALPASLDDAAMALGLKIRKDFRGKQLIKLLSIPDKDTGRFNEDPVLHEEFREYCMTDVLVTAAIVDACRLMTTTEHADWLKTCEVNERGIKVDLELATHALKYAAIEQGEIGVALKKETDGMVEKHTQNQRIKQWILKKIHELHPIVQDMTIYKNNVAKLSLDKNIRRTILTKIDAGDYGDKVPDSIREVIILLDEGNMSSVGKFKRMLAIADPDDHRVRGAFAFAGASQTLRYASRGLQVHNMKRDCWNASETEVIKDIMYAGGNISTAESSVMESLAKLMRPAIIPDEGNVLIVGDWSQIEARCLHWLSDTPQGDDKLDVFDSDVDVYQKVADDMKFDDRQTGKVAELSCGYQGGFRALQHMARNYGVNFSEAAAQIVVDKWRGGNWHIVEFWKELERAAMNAVNHPGKKYKAGAVEYIFNPNLMKGTLLCIMPGDHIIQYPQARISQVKTPWGEEKAAVTCMKAGYHPKADAKQWPRAALYGGLLCENICQAFAAAILRNALRECPPTVTIAHVHDEIIWEVPKGDAENYCNLLQSIMLRVPDWAEGLPLDAAPVIMSRYGK